MTYLGLQGKPLRIVVSVIAATAFALQGYDQGLMNGLITLKTFLHTFPQMKNSDIEGTTVAIYEVGSAIGALSCAFIGNILGRRRTIFIAGCICVVGIILQTTSFSLGQLIASRIITGLGVGALTATIPMWVAECSNANERGRLVLTQGIFATIGTVAAAWLEFGLLFTTSAANWRFPIAFQGVYILIVTSLVLFLPESPRWLITKDQPEQASSVLSALQGLPISSPTITQEIAQMRASYREEQHQQSTSALFNTSPERPFHRATLAILVAIFGQMCGLNIVTFYSDTILETQLHYSASETRIFSGCMQIWQMLSACLSVLVIDRFGRRKLLLCGAVGMCITQAALAGLMSDLSTSPAAAKAAIFLYFCAMFFFPIGLFLIPFMYAAEIAPLAIRHQVTAIAACANWLFNFLVAEVTPHAMENIGYRYYIVYACINAFAVVVVGFFCPETRGRSLEEMDEVFVRSRGLLDPVRLEKGMPRRAEGEGIGGGDVEKELDVRLEGGS